MRATSPYDHGHKTKAGYRDVTPAETYAARGAVRLVDVREPHEFNDQLGHIPGAELVPLATVAAQARGWDAGADIILVCRSGGRSGRAAETLVGAGFRRVMNMTGGMIAYNAAHLPVERA
jgi:rhodanese-related sulfurtransferase